MLLVIPKPMSSVDSNEFILLQRNDLILLQQNGTRRHNESFNRWSMPSHGFGCGFLL